MSARLNKQNLYTKINRESCNKMEKKITKIKVVRDGGLK